MHRNRFIACLWSLLLSGWLFAACTAPEDTQPDNLIAEPKMVAILTQIHLTEARVSRLSFRSPDSSNFVYNQLEKAIFQQFQVDTSAYRKSYIYYSSHPQQFETIYKQVTENLKQKADALQKRKPVQSTSPEKPAPPKASARSAGPTRFEKFTRPDKIHRP